MTVRARFLAGLVLGAAGSLLYGVGGLFAIGLLVLAAVPLAIGRDGLAFLSGLLASFGASWLALLSMQSSTNGEDLVPWVALGAVSLTLGIALGAIRIAITGRAPRASGA